MTTSIGEHSTRRVTLKVGDADLELLRSRSGCPNRAAARWGPGGRLLVRFGRRSSRRWIPGGPHQPARRRRQYGPTDGLTLHDFAADVAGVIEGLDLAPAFVLGHTFGNRIAREPSQRTGRNSLAG